MREPICKGGPREMRRTYLIILNSLFFLLCGVWIGATVGVGALAAPAAFRALEGKGPDGVAMAGLVVGGALERLNALSVFLLAGIVALATLELFARQRNTTRRLLGARWILSLAALAVTVYIAGVLMPKMQDLQAAGSMDVFRSMHGRYRMWTMLQVLMGFSLIIQTVAVNIGPRRDGGHPREDAGSPAPLKEASR